jgi:hypothetical protein
MKPPKQTIVFAKYVGSSAFFLHTPERPLGLVTAYPSDEQGNPVPPEVWLRARRYHQTGLKDHLVAAATNFLGYAPTHLRVSLPKGGAA